MKTPVVPSVLVCVVMGAVLGFGALEAGAIGIALALLVLVLLIKRPEQVGSYMVSFGLTGLVVLGHVVLTCRAPSCQFDASTPIAMAVDGVITVAGAGILARAFLKARST